MDSPDRQASPSPGRPSVPSLSPRCGELFGVVDTTAVDWGKKSPEKDEPEEEKKAGEGGGTYNSLDGKWQVTTSTRKFDEKCQHQCSGSGEMKVPVDGPKAASKHQVDAQEPCLLSGAEQTHMSALVDEGDESKNKVKKRKRSHLEKIKKEKQVLEELASKDSRQLRWCASFCTLLFLGGRNLVCKGSILLDPEVNRVTLLDTVETTIDWEMAEAIHSLLKIFFEATNVVSGSSYPTSNRYFHEIWSVRQLLEKHTSNENPILASMVRKMQKKFDKYWKESYLANCIPVILDPRYKMGFIDFRLRKAFGDDAVEHLQKVDMIIKSLFEDYSHEMGDSLATNPPEEVHDDGVAEFDDSLADWEAHLRVQKKKATNELERYLSEELFPPQRDFDILGWWKMHGPKYPVMSCIARDVLAIQASTVASESSFSAGGRIVSDHRSRLKSEMVEALICLQDWLKVVDLKPTNKDDEEEEEYLVFQKVLECDEETVIPQSPRSSENL